MTFLVVIWSANYVVGKIGLRELPPLALASFRLVLGGAVLAPFYLFSTRSSRGQSVSRTQLPAASRSTARLHDLWTFTYLGFFGVVMNQGFFTVGLSYTSVSHSSLIIGFAPVLILLMSCAAGL
jgi:drug/metabolite transporter (DMT)-like permease